MAVIGIRKLIEINDTGYYAVSVESDKIYDFYMGIDKQKKVINFYENINFGKPNLSIDYESDYKMTGEFHGIEPRILLRVAYLSSRIFQQDNFPDSCIWASCGS